MKTREEMKRYFDILEIGEDAALSEAEYAYRLLKDLYSGRDMAIAPLDDEFGEEERGRVLGEIEEAYRHVAAYFRQEGTTADGAGEIASEEEIREYAGSIISFSGSDLKKIRTMRGLGLRSLAESTNISRRYLEGIEAERFTELPAKIYLKGFIATYAERLGLKGKRVAEDMMARLEGLYEKKEE